jgi:type VI secretion system secreted protein Hcp
MANEAYMTFRTYDGKLLAAESKVELQNAKGIQEATKIFSEANGNGAIFEVEEYSFDIEQVLNIGSQSTGAGAGAVSFNPFSITRKVDLQSPTFFQMACSGTPFKEVCLGIRKAAGGDQAGSFYLMFRFLLVAVKTLGWAHDEQAPKETVTFEYGAMQIFYGPQKPDGSITKTFPSGWNRVKNMSLTSSQEFIT